MVKRVKLWRALGSGKMGWEKRGESERQVGPGRDCHPGALARLRLPESIGNVQWSVKENHP